MYAHVNTLATFPAAIPKLTLTWADATALCQVTSFFESCLKPELSSRLEMGVISLGAMQVCINVPWFCFRDRASAFAEQSLILLHVSLELVYPSPPSLLQAFIQDESQPKEQTGMI